jgi:hypothetical protein
MLSARDVRAQLAEFVRDHARWRDSKRQEGDLDERTQRSAERLWLLAAHVDGLPDDDRRLVALARVHAQHGHEGFVVGDDARYLVSRYAFDSEDSDQGVDRFLTKFVSVLVAQDRREQLDALDAQLDSAEVDGILRRFTDED